jgi:hypothetical protein
MVEIQVLRGEEVVHARPLGHAPLHVGRAATNDLVLADHRISSRHAVIWIDGGEVRVEDLGSRNGTFVNEKAAKGPTAVANGDRIRLGTDTVLRVVGTPELAAVQLGGALELEDLDAGVRVPLRSDRFRIGSAEDADLRLADGPDRAATLLVHDSGEVWLGTDDDEHPVSVGEVFTVAGRRLCLREIAGTTRTEAVEATRYPYRLKVTLQGPTGPEALLEEPATGRAYRIDTENRATLLWLLARQQVRDRAEGRGEAEAGWCDDDAVVTGVWGRGKDRLDPNNYHVLVCRLRKELRDAGFDGWFIEKRKKHIRLRLGDVFVADEP